MRITGTFLDEITHDIPAQNWGPKEWSREFDSFRKVGIDTVILIRGGYKNRLCFDSTYLSERVAALPSYGNLLEVFLKESERCHINFFMGTYDSGQYWHTGHYEKEVDLNLGFCEEVIKKYGSSSAFKGWYISHEVHAFNEGMMKVYERLSRELRALKKIPVLMSPFVKGAKQFGQDSVSFEEHAQAWTEAMSRLEGHVDILAFQDGQMPYAELPQYLKLHRELSARHGFLCWSNLESFDRDMPWKFPPADYRNLFYKIDQAATAQVDKLITFEFSHFMSPQSSFPSARNLYARYCEKIGITA